MRRHRFLTLLLTGAGFATGCRPAPAPKAGTTAIRVAAAADLKFALEELVREYRTMHPQAEVAITFGSSGSLYAQLGQQAPFDLFLAADIDYPRKLMKAGQGLDDVFPYAVGHLVVWVPQASPIDVEKLGMQALNHPSVKKIAIANPRTAPYGRAAVAAMQSLGVHAAAEPRLVLGENVSQAAQFVQSGAADIGIIALSLALSPEMQKSGRYWEVPLDAYPPLVQGGMIMKQTKDPAAARQFRDYLQTPEARQILKRYGFVLPPQ